MPLSESSAYDPKSQNHPPPSMGPGAGPIPRSSESRPQTSADLQALAREVAEIRSHYRVEIQESTLKVSYTIKELSRNYSMQFQNLPLSDATRWALYGGAGRAMVTGTFVIDVMRGAEKMATRPITQSEAEAFALHASRRTLYSFAATLSAFSIGIGMAALGRKKMKFPFRKPKAPEKYSNFPNRFLPIIKGQPARIMWHITRTSVYIGVSLMLLNPLYASMGNSAMMVGLYRDTRTTEIMKTLKEKGARLNRIGSNLETPEKRQDQGGMQQQQQQQQGDYGRYEDPDPEGYYNENQTGVVNDYGGGHSYPTGDSAYTDGTTDTGMMDDAAIRANEATQSSPSSFSGSPAWRTAQQSPPKQKGDRSGMQPGSNYPTGSFFDDDDASPTAGNESYSSLSGTVEGGGSAWGRVRSGQAPDANRKGVTPPGSKHRPGPAAQGLQERDRAGGAEVQGDSYSFTREGEERQLAKEMAQREFDNMVERERRGSAAADRSAGATMGDGESGDGRSAWERRR